MIEEIQDVFAEALRAIFIASVLLIFFVGLFILVVFGPKIFDSRPPKPAPITKKKKVEKKMVFDKYGKQIAGPKTTKPKSNWFRDAMHAGTMAAEEYKLKKIEAENAELEAKSEESLTKTNLEAALIRGNE